MENIKADENTTVLQLLKLIVPLVLRLNAKKSVSPLVTFSDNANPKFTQDEVSLTTPYKPQIAYTKQNSINPQRRNPT